MLHIENSEPEPSGVEGMADVSIIQAIYESAKTGKSIELEPVRKSDKPRLNQAVAKPAVKKTGLVHAKPPVSKESGMIEVLTILKT